MGKDERVGIFLPLGISTTGEENQGGGLTNVFNLKSGGKGTQEGLAKRHSADRPCILSKAEKSLLHIYFKKISSQGVGITIGFKEYNHRHSKPVSDCKRPVYEM